MTNQLRRFRGPLVAVVAVVFSAGAVLAAHPSVTGLANASQHAGKTVPVQAGKGSGGSDDATDPNDSEATDAADASNDTSDANHCNVDLTQDPSVLATLNHGSVVCTAAQMPTPQGYANHGAWVSHWAHMGHGSKGTGNTDHPSGPPSGVPPVSHPPTSHPPVSVPPSH